MSRNSKVHKILIADRFDTEVFHRLNQEPLFEVSQAQNGKSLKAAELEGVEALVIRSRTTVHEQLLNLAPQLKLIITTTSGFDHIDIELCQTRGVHVMYTPNAHIESTAELTWSLVLACSRKILPAHKAVKSGEWNRDLLVGTELSGKTYGIVGLGRIGSRVADFAKAFNMQILAYDPFQDDKHFKNKQAMRVSFEELLKLSDIVSFHVPKNPLTENMLSLSQMEYMNRHLILVNTSRGSVISEQSLCTALEKNWLQAVGLDVFEKEPLARDSGLMKYPNVVMTPHIGATTAEALHKASLETMTKLIEFFQHNRLSDTLPPKAAWYGAQGFVV